MHWWASRSDFLRRVSHHSFAFVAQGQVDGSRDLLPNGGVGFDLATDDFHGIVGTKIAMGERPVLAQKAEQDVLGLDVLGDPYWLAS